jgi:hypothetical protein
LVELAAKFNQTDLVGSADPGSTVATRVHVLPSERRRTPMRSLLALFILVSTCSLAQETPNQAPNRDPNRHSTMPSAYQGCVIRENGNIFLADASNTNYKLVSNARSLDSYVGREVRITATLMNPADPSSGEKSIGGGEPQNPPKTLDVEDIAKVADHCTSPR